MQFEIWESYRCKIFWSFWKIYYRVCCKVIPHRCNFCNVINWILVQCSGNSHVWFIDIRPKVTSWQPRWSFHRYRLGSSLGFNSIYRCQTHRLCVLQQLHVCILKLPTLFPLLSSSFNLSLSLSPLSPLSPLSFLFLSLSLLRIKTLSFKNNKISL